MLLNNYYLLCINAKVSWKSCLCVNVMVHKGFLPGALTFQDVAEYLRSLAFAAFAGRKEASSDGNNESRQKENKTEENGDFDRQFVVMEYIKA